MEAFEPDAGDVASEQRRLEPAARVALAVIGSIVAGGGVAAGFVTADNGGAGAAALILIGAAVLTVAALGALPRQIEIGGANMDLPLGQRARQLADEARKRGRE